MTFLVAIFYDLMSAIFQVCSNMIALCVEFQWAFVQLDQPDI